MLLLMYYNRSNSEETKMVSYVVFIMEVLYWK
jgi:hypothetical protein